MTHDWWKAFVRSYQQQRQRCGAEQRQYWASVDSAVHRLHVGRPVSDCWMLMLMLKSPFKQDVRPDGRHDMLCQVCVHPLRSPDLDIWPFDLQSLSLLRILSVNWRHITDLVSAKGKTKEMYCCDIVVLIVLFWCFWCVKDYKVESVCWNIVWWGCESISINWLFYSWDGHLPSINFGFSSLSSSSGAG